MAVMTNSNRRTKSNSCWRCCRRHLRGRVRPGREQPLTCGVWKGDWSTPEKMTAMDRLQIELSDVITFHNYDSPDGTGKTDQLAQAL